MFSQYTSVQKTLLKVFERSIDISADRETKACRNAGFN